MNSGPLLFFGIFLTLASSFWGLVLAPQLQIGRQTPIPAEGIGQFYPNPRPGLAKQGAEVYRALGCVECHSQQVRGLGGDLERGWGPRISVAQDYLYDYPVLIGSSRLGPDLANSGARHADAQWHMVHLFDPKKMVPDSPMPRYPFLFEKEPENARFPSLGALPIVIEEKGERFRLVPKPEAHALVAYLQSLRANTSLFEAPIPLPATNGAPAAAGATNGVAGAVEETGTNAPAADAAAETNAPADAP